VPYNHREVKGFAWKLWDRESICVVFSFTPSLIVPVLYASDRRAFRLVIVLSCVGVLSSAASRRINALQMRSTSCGDRDSATGTLFAAVLFSGWMFAFSGTLVVDMLFAFLTRVPLVCLAMSGLPRLFCFTYLVTYREASPYVGILYPLGLSAKDK
jgi:hypothetical protein